VPVWQVTLERFIHERTNTYLRAELGYTASEVEAVLLDDVEWPTLIPRLDAVRSFRALPESEALAAANKRIDNILKKSGVVVEAEVALALLKEPAEVALQDALTKIAPQAQYAFEHGDYTGSLQALASLKVPVDDFFDKVMVNAEDPALRANRLGLLAQLHAAMNRVADLSKLAT
jgi:glycyl-tRNA synthetase beta chain